MKLAHHFLTSYTLYLRNRLNSMELLCFTYNYVPTICRHIDISKSPLSQMPILGLVVKCTYFYAILIIKNIFNTWHTLNTFFKFATHTSKFKKQPSFCFPQKKWNLAQHKHGRFASSFIQLYLTSKELCLSPRNRVDQSKMVTRNQQ